MNKKLIAFLIIFSLFFIVNSVSAGNNTAVVDTPTTTYINSNETVTALESGDSNIQFSNGYKGYCIEWSEHSAEENETFYVEPTNKIINKETHEDVSNYIKTMFLFFYNKTQENPVATQHMIWKFTDNKEFSKFDKDWYNQIVTMSNCVQIPDSCNFKINATHNCFFSFKAFIAQINEYQNYFGYKFIISEILPNSSTNLIENITNKNTTNITNYQNNQSINQLNKSVNKKLINQLHTCGCECSLLGIAIITIISILLLDNRIR